MKKVFHGDLAPIGLDNGAAPRPVKARHASGLLGSLWGAVDSLGGGSTGHRTKDALARLTEAKTKHGKFTKEKCAEAKRRAEQGRQVRGELKELESWFVDHGHLDKKWRDWFV